MKRANKMSSCEKVLNFYLKKFTLLNAVLILTAIVLIISLFYNCFYLPQKRIQEINEKIPCQTSSLHMNTVLFEKILNSSKEKTNLKVDFSSNPNPFVLKPKIKNIESETQN